MNKEVITCDSEYDPNAKTVDEAIEIIRQGTSTLEGFERSFIGDALGRVLAAPVTAPVDVPPHRNSAMDGYAVNAEALPAEGDVELKVIGKSLAGHPFEGEVKAGECVRIMTGAMMPEGTDTSVMQEYVEQNGDMATIPCPQKAGANVRYPGEDMKAGDEVLLPGRELTAADLGLLASMGQAEVKIYRQPRVAFFSTGDELKSLGQPLGPGDIYDSNRYTIAAMIKNAGAIPLDMGVIPDEPDAVHKAFVSASENADMIITSGGVSVGEADFVTKTLSELGQVNFWKIAMKPGRPMAFGKIGNALFFGLPGNPVSVMATFQIFVRQALEVQQGKQRNDRIRFKARLLSNLKKAPGRTDFQRGVFSLDDNGELVVDSTGMQGSHILRSMSQANCFIVVARDSGAVEAGEWVDVMPFDS